MSVTRLVWGVAVGAVVAALVVEGPHVFTLETHWLQRLQAWMEIGAAICAFRLARVSEPARALLAAAATWLAVDETLMVHECAKPYLAPIAPYVGGDPLVGIYAVAGAAALVALARKLVWSRTTVAFAIVAVLSAATTVATDSLHVVGGDLGAVLEEIGELFAGAAVVALLLAQPQRPRSTWPALAFVAVTAAWMFGSVLLLRPEYCPSRFWS